MDPIFPSWHRFISANSHMAMSMKRKIKISIYYLLYCAIIVLLAFSIGEIVLRLNPQFAETKNHVEWLRSMMTYDELLGWRHVPGAEVSSETPEYSVRYTINSKGLRGEEHSYNKGKRFRIICPGDSFTFGWGVAAEDRFSDILKNLIGDTEAVNMGVQGYGIDQELLQLQREGVKYEPDLIVLYVIPHDLTRACYSKMWDKPKPRFVLEEGALRLTNVPVPGVDMFSFSNPTLDRIRYQLGNKSYFFYYLQDRLYNRYAHRINASGDEAIKIELAKAIFTEMQKTAESLKAKLVIIGALPVELKEFFREKNIYYCPDPLAAYPGNPGDIRYTEFHHPNASGHRLIAEGIYDFLIENNLVPEKHIEEQHSPKQNVLTDS